MTESSNYNRGDILRMESKLDSLITQQHQLAERLTRSGAEMKVRLEEYEKRLDRHHAEIVYPLGKRVEILQAKQNQIVGDLKEISQSLREVSKTVSSNRSEVDKMQITRARAAGVVAAVAAFITFVSGIATAAWNALIGG